MGICLDKKNTVEEVDYVAIKMPIVIVTAQSPLEFNRACYFRPIRRKPTRVKATRNHTHRGASLCHKTPPP